MSQKKICKQCDKEKLLSEFRGNPKCRDGHIGICQDCINLSFPCNRNYIYDENSVLIKLVCTKCQDAKSLSEFYAKPSSRRGYSQWCKTCTDGKNSEWAKTHPEKVRATKRRYANKIKADPRPPIMEGVKICRICKEEKDVTEFHPNPKMRDGRINECKTCWNKRPRKNILVKVCQKCGNEFLSRTKTQRYCSNACAHGEGKKKDCICLNCGKQFTTKATKVGKYCSEWCRKHTKHTWTTGSTQTDTLVCKRCDKEFHPKRALQKYCSPRCSTPNATIYIKTCEVCEETYETNRETSVVCSNSCGARRRVGKIKRSATVSQHGYREDIGHPVRSSWEANVARWLVAKGYTYQYEQQTFHYKDFSYTPDFYINELDLYLEVKGVWREREVLKTNVFAQEHPNIAIVDRPRYKQLGFNPNLLKEYTIDYCRTATKIDLTEWLWANAKDGIRIIKGKKKRTSEKRTKRGGFHAMKMPALTIERQLPLLQTQ